jgi:hypothetical protein
MDYETHDDLWKANKRREKRDGFMNGKQLCYEI